MGALARRRAVRRRKRDACSMRVGETEEVDDEAEEEGVVEGCFSSSFSLVAREERMAGADDTKLD